jgi:small subunit ribosomal protein S2
MTKKQTEHEGKIRQLFEVGAHFGYSKSRCHPSTKNNIFGFKNRSAVIDLEKTLVGLEAAKERLMEVGRHNKAVLLVGTKEEAKAPVYDAAGLANWPYIASSRWLGGLLTNWPQMKTRLARLADLKDKREAGKLSVYTKKEQLLISREIARLERYFGTITSLTDLPAILIVVDPDQEKIAVEEARKVKIPVIALAGTDCDIRIYLCLQASKLHQYLLSQTAMHL